MQRTYLGPVLPQQTLEGRCARHQVSKDVQQVKCANSCSRKITWPQMLRSGSLQAHRAARQLSKVTKQWLTRFWPLPKSCRLQLHSAALV